MKRISFLGLLLAVGISRASADPVCPGAQWEHVDPHAAGWNVEKLVQVRRRLESMATSAMVVVHRGKLVMDYGRPSAPILVRSVRKSLLSVLYGIARERGQIDLEADLQELGVDDRCPLTVTEKTATIKDLLSARSCVYIAAAAETAAMEAARPPRGSCRPGESWYYNNWDFNALGTIYQARTGSDVFTALETELAQPLQFEHFSKARDTRNLYVPTSIYPAYHMYLSAKDLARIGVLMSRGGDWCGRRIVSERWIVESTAPISSATGNPGIAYGYLWWVGENRIHFGNRFSGPVFSARGHLGQVLLVARSEDLVIAHLVESASETRRLQGGQFNDLLTLLRSAMPQ